MECFHSCIKFLNEKYCPDIRGSYRWTSSHTINTSVTITSWKGVSVAITIFKINNKWLRHLKLIDMVRTSLIRDKSSAIIGKYDLLSPGNMVILIYAYAAKVCHFRPSLKKLEYWIIKHSQRCYVNSLFYLWLCKSLFLRIKVKIIIKTTPEIKYILIIIVFVLEEFCWAFYLKRA